MVSPQSVQRCAGPASASTGSTSADPQFGHQHAVMVGFLSS
jgi:hypothetical protein